MMFFEDTIRQALKAGQSTCGDYCMCERNIESTVLVVCDGIGSGIYANIAAISCANRLMELFRTGISFAAACEMVADSMHRARTEDIPFSAFTAVKMLYDGNFTIYTYEAPEAVLIRNGTAAPVKPRFYTVGYEAIGEAFGSLGLGDSLMVFSDGITQAGLGNGYNMGVGADGIAAYLNRKLSENDKIDADTLEDLLKYTSRLSGGFHADDATAAMLRCREANQINIMTGPPSQRGMDGALVQRFLSEEGLKLVCGSTTADIVSRELHKDVELVGSSRGFGAPPEYVIGGIDLVTEGAIVLNQVNNILGEDPEHFVENTVVERICRIMQDADIVRFLVGSAINDAHSMLLFKQMGVRPRMATVELIAEQLKKMGKLVTIEHF